MTKIPTYTTSAIKDDPQLDYVFSDGSLVTVLLGLPEPTAIYRHKGSEASYVSDLTKLDDMRLESVHTTHTLQCRNPDGTPYFETYTINDTIPPRFEENNE